MVSDERAEKALRFLAESDEEAAIAKADMERAEFKAKAIRQTVFKIADGSVADRNALAETSDDYRHAMDLYFVALQKYAHMANKRETEKIVLDTWRTISANRRHG